MLLFLGFTWRHLALVWKVPWQVGWQWVPWRHSPNRGVCLPAVDNTLHISIDCIMKLMLSTNSDSTKKWVMTVNGFSKAAKVQGWWVLFSVEAGLTTVAMEHGALCWSYTGNDRISDRYLARGLSQMPLVSHKYVPHAQPYGWIHVSAWGSNKPALADLIRHSINTVLD